VYIQNEKEKRSYCGFVSVGIKPRTKWIDLISDLPGKETNNGSRIKEVVRMTVDKHGVKDSQVVPEEINDDNQIKAFVIFGMF
jgi:hypothetical protein